VTVIPTEYRKPALSLQVEDFTYKKRGVPNE
jgi:hypothetical protein